MRACLCEPCVSVCACVCVMSHAWYVCALHAWRMGEGPNWLSREALRPRRVHTFQPLHARCAQHLYHYRLLFMGAQWVPHVDLNTCRALDGWSLLPLILLLHAVLLWGVGCAGAAQGFSKLSCWHARVWCARRPSSFARSCWTLCSARVSFYAFLRPFCPLAGWPLRLDIRPNWIRWCCWRATYTLGRCSC